jgi:hypothetical protein
LKRKSVSSLSLRWPPLWFWQISTLYQSDDTSKEDSEVLLKMWYTAVGLKLQEECYSKYHCSVDYFTIVLNVLHCGSLLCSIHKDRP